MKQPDKAKQIKARQTIEEILGTDEISAYNVLGDLMGYHVLRNSYDDSIYFRGNKEDGKGNESKLWSKGRLMEYKTEVMCQYGLSIKDFWNCYREVSRLYEGDEERESKEGSYKLSHNSRDNVVKLNSGN